MRGQAGGTAATGCFALSAYCRRQACFHTVQRPILMIDLPSYLKELSVALVCLAAGDSGSGAPRPGHVDVSNLEGLHRWLGALYNDHRLLYALLGVALIMAGGALLGLLMEGALSLLGWGTKRIEHVE